MTFIVFSCPALHCLHSPGQSNFYVFLLKLYGSGLLWPFPEPSFNIPGHCYVQSAFQVLCLYMGALLSVWLKQMNRGACHECVLVRPLTPGQDCMWDTRCPSIRVNPGGFDDRARLLSETLNRTTLHPLSCLPFINRPACATSQVLLFNQRRVDISMTHHPSTLWKICSDVWSALRGNTHAL